MSDKVITLDNTKGQDERSRDQEHTLVTARLQWVANLVSAILNAQSIKRPSEMARRPSVR
jgi:hypothetical protein